MATFASILGAINTALSVIKTATAIPGASLIPYVSTVSSVVDTIQFALGKGANVAGLVSDLADTFSNGLPSQDKLDALDAKIAALRVKLHAPLPDKEEGEEE
jgi:hypothetical protein